MNNHLLEALIQGVPYGVLLLDPDGEILLGNQEVLTHFDLSLDANTLPGKNVVALLTTFPVLEKAIKRFLLRGSHSFDLKALLVQRRYLTVHLRRVGAVLVLTTEDVTKAKQLEMAATNALLEGQEEERRRLAKEIHDGIGPLLSTIQLHLDGLQFTTPSIIPPSDHPKVNNIKTLLRNVAADLRDISHALMPSVILDFGLVTALENLARSATESEQIQVSFICTGLVDRDLDATIELGLFRITQELLSNALKYSQAKNIIIQLVKHPQSVVLMVEDDGIGFDAHRVRSYTNEGMGLRNVETRTLSMGGFFTLDTQQGRGVVASIEIPLN